MKELWTLGEALCEIMRTEVDAGLKKPNLFRGPFASGAPAIFIDTVAKLGYPCGFFGTVGDDEFGECISEKLQQDGVNCGFMHTSRTLSTGVAFVAYDSKGDRKFLYHIGNAAAGEIYLPEQFPENVGIFHVMGCAMMPSEAMKNGVLACVKHYYDRGCMITFDPNLRAESLKDQNLADLIQPVMERCTVLLPGVEELLEITEASTVEDAVQTVFTKFPNIKIIALKNGGKNCRIITREEDFSVNTCKVQVLDTTGAGDSFDAGFLSSYLAGKSLRECAEVACAAGALNCAAFGPMEGKITPEAVQALIQDNYTA